MLAQARSEEQQRLAANRPGASKAAISQSDEGYWAYMQRQVQERTEKLSMMGDGMQNLEENSAGWASDVSNFVNKQKRGAVTGCKSSLGDMNWRALTNGSDQAQVWFLIALYLLLGIDMSCSWSGCCIHGWPSKGCIYVATHEINLCLRQEGSRDQILAPSARLTLFWV